MIWSIFSVARDRGKASQVMESDGVNRTREETIRQSSSCFWIYRARDHFSWHFVIGDNSGGLPAIYELIVNLHAVI
jgi:hypothetical protein